MEKNWRLAKGMGLWLSIWIGLWSILLLPQPAQAGDHFFDLDRVRAARQSGQVIAYEQLQAEVKKACNCQVLESKLHEEKGLLVYEVKALQNDGRIIKLALNAHNGALLGMKSKGYKD